MSLNQELLEQVQVRQRLLTDLLEEQSLIMVEYKRFENAYKQNEAVLEDWQRHDARTTLAECRLQIDLITDRILKLQHEITTIIRGDV